MGDEQHNSVTDPVPEFVNKALNAAIAFEFQMVDAGGVPIPYNIGDARKIRRLELQVQCLLRAVRSAGISDEAMGLIWLDECRKRAHEIDAQMASMKSKIVIPTPAETNGLTKRNALKFPGVP